MTDLEVFTTALNLKFPWKVESVTFIDAKDKLDKQELHIYISHEKSVLFAYKEGKEYSVYDHQSRTWRHLDFHPVIIKDLIRINTIPHKK